jgi:hypothetical protein
MGCRVAEDTDDQLRYASMKISQCKRTQPASTPTPGSAEYSCNDNDALKEVGAGIDEFYDSVELDAKRVAAGIGSRCVSRVDRLLLRN